MPEPIHPAERLLNLVIALVNTSARMTKEQIRRSVAGYADAPSPDAFERMFERDKDTLRELGIPILTVTGSGHGDDIGYRIDQEAYALPPIELTAAELGVLSLAAQFWQDSSARTDTSRALTKLRAVGAAPEAADLVAGLAPRVRAGGDAFAPLLDAVQARQAVTFTYRAASTGEVRTRVVEPWKLLARRGGWYVVGHDRDRGAPRSFRLSRVEGRVRPVGPPGAFPAPDPESLTSVLGPSTEDAARVATLAVRPERAEALRARAIPAAVVSPTAAVSPTVSPAVVPHQPAVSSLTAVPSPTGAGDTPDGTDLADVSDPAIAAVLADRDVIRLPFSSTWDLAEEVVGYGDAVVVLAPLAVRETVLRMLRVAATLDDEVPGAPTLDVTVPDEPAPPGETSAVRPTPTSDTQEGDRG